jgi:hypothetical protein
MDMKTTSDRYKDLDIRITKLEKYYNNIVFEPNLQEFYPETKHSVVHVISRKKSNNQHLALEIARQYENVNTWNIFSKNSEFWKDIGEDNIFDFDEMELDRIYKEQLDLIKVSNETKTIGIIFDNMCYNRKFIKSEAVQNIINRARHFNIVVILCDQHFSNPFAVDYLAFVDVSGHDLKYIYDWYLNDIIIDNKNMNYKLFLRLFQEREGSIIYNRFLNSNKFEDKFRHVNFFACIN